MKESGNLSNICAKRSDVLYTSLDGMVTVYVGSGPDRARLQAKWDDDNAIMEIIRELNHGKYSRENTEVPNKGDFLTLNNCSEMFGKATVSILAQFPELDTTPEFITFFIDAEIEASTVVEFFREVVRIEKDGNNDRFTALDNVIEIVEHEFNCTSQRLPITSVVDIF